MINIAYIQPLFIRDTKTAEEAAASVLALKEYLEEHEFRHLENFKLRLYFITYPYFSHTVYEEIIRVPKLKDLKNLTYGHVGRNIGKARAVNEMAKYAFEADYIFTLDSDIVLNCSKPDIFKPIITSMEEEKSIGVIALDQNGDSRHLYHTFDVIKKVGNVVLARSSLNCGIAGGCLLIRKSAFDKIGGYREMGVYSGDDAYLLGDMKKAEYECWCCLNHSVLHPRKVDEDKKFNEWKEKCLARCRENKGERTTDLESYIKEYEEEVEGRIKPASKITIP